MTLFTPMPADNLHFDRVVDEVWDELLQAAAEWPDWPTGDKVRAAAIVVEEAGEALKAAQDVENMWRVEGTERLPGDLDDTRRELIQTAAMCLRAIQDIDEARGD